MSERAPDGGAATPPVAGAPPGRRKTDPAKGLARRTRHGISWTAAGAVASNLIRLGVYAALGRIVSRTEFGIVAAAMTVIQFGATLRDLGIGGALVQRQDLEPEHVETAFTFSLVMGVAFGSAVFAGSGVFARFYGIEPSVGIIQMLSVLFILRGIALVPSFMCRRNMRFRALTLVDLAGYIAGSAVSIGLALGGAGAWSLAWGYVAETTINVGLLVYLSPPPPRLRLHKRHLRDLLGFGMGQSAANLSNYFANNGDYMVVGHVLGPAQLGVYQRAYELMKFPATVFSSVAGTVLTSAFAKVQDDPERLGRAYRRALFASALVLLPAAAGLIVLAPEVVQILLGPGWTAVAWPFRIMAISMLFRTTYKLGYIVGNASGAVYAIAIWETVYAACVIGGAMVAVRWDVIGVAATTAFAVFLQFLAMSRLAVRATSLRPRDVALAHIEPAIFAAAVGAAAWLTATGLRDAGLAFPVVAAGTTIAGTLVFFALARIGVARGKRDWPWLRETLGQFAGRRKRKARSGDAPSPPAPPG